MAVGDGDPVGTLMRTLVGLVLLLAAYVGLAMLSFVALAIGVRMGESILRWAGVS